MPAICAAGDIAAVMYVFPGVRVSDRTFERNGRVQVETLASHLPRNSAVTMRPEISGVDSKNFYECAKLFVEHIRDFTANNRTVLLTFDGYRSHMSLRDLEMFRDIGMLSRPCLHILRERRSRSMCHSSIALKRSLLRPSASARKQKVSTSTMFTTSAGCYAIPTTLRSRAPTSSQHTRMPGCFL